MPSGATAQSEMLQLKETIEQLTAALHHSESERAREKERLANAIIQSEQTGFEIIQRARSDAEKIAQDAKAETERIKTAAIIEAKEIRRRIEAEISSLRQTLTNMTETAETSKQKCFSLYQTLSNHINSLSDMLAGQQATFKTASVEKDTANNDEFFHNMSEKLRNVTISDTPPGKNPNPYHRIFGDDI